MPQITIMDGTGDSAIQFDPEDPTTLERANAAFDELVGTGTGRRAFAINEPGKPGTPIERFDPGVAEIVVLAPVAGG